MDARKTGVAGGSSTSGAARPSPAASSTVAGGPAPGLGVLADGGQRRGDVGGQGHVVEAGDRQVAGHLEAAPDGHAHAGDGHDVVGVDDRGGWVGQLQQGPGGGRPARAGEVGHQLGPGGDPGRLQGLAPGGAPRQRVDIALGAADERDPAVTEAEQVLDRPGHPLAVVDGHHRERARPGRPPDRHRGQAEPGQQAEAALLDLEVVEEHPVDPALCGQPPVAGRLGLVVVGHDLEDQRAAPLGQHRLHPGQELGEERVGPEQLGRPRASPARPRTPATATAPLPWCSAATPAHGPRPGSGPGSGAPPPAGR